ncbi:hypothetical protein BC826DRAFT_547565 [Russula brevipes]|nr:hypothetical protein BC826DRAFT_547565 [Russula brevipes]
MPHGNTCNPPGFFSATHLYLSLAVAVQPKPTVLLHLPQGMTDQLRRAAPWALRYDERVQMLPRSIRCPRIFPHPMATRSQHTNVHGKRDLHPPASAVSLHSILHRGVEDSSSSPLYFRISTLLYSPLPHWLLRSGSDQSRKGLGPNNKHGEKGGGQKLNTRLHAAQPR